MRTLFLLIPALLLAGCMHRNAISTETPPDYIERINQQIARHEGTVAMKSGVILAGHDFVIGKDATTWCAPRSEQPTVMPNSEICHLTVPDKRMGLAEGLTNGPIVGAFIGAGLGILAYIITPAPHVVYAPSDSGSWGYWDSDQGGKRSLSTYVGLGALSGAVIGCGIGILIGGGVGSLIRIEYVSPVVKPK